MPPSYTALIFISYNVHNLIHLTDDCMNYEPLYFFGFFDFENYLQKIKRLMKNTQLARRLGENNIPNLSNKKRIHFKKQNDSGQFIHSNQLKGAVQYKELHCAVGYLICNSPDNYLILKDHSVK